MKTKGHRHSSEGEKGVSQLGAAGKVCPSGMEVKTSTPLHPHDPAPYGTNRTKSTEFPNSTEQAKERQV